MIIHNYLYDNAISLAGTATNSKSFTVFQHQAISSLFKPFLWVPHRLGVFHKRDQLGEVSHQLTFDLGVGQLEKILIVVNHITMVVWL